MLSGPDLAGSVLTVLDSSARRRGTATDVKPDKELSEFAALLRTIRRSKGLSQIEVAKRGGLGRGYLGMVETGERGARPVRDSVIRVANGLGASEEERNALLRAAGFPPIDPKLLESSHTEDALLSDPSLSDSARKILLDMYRALRASSEQPRQRSKRQQ